MLLYLIALYLSVSSPPSPSVDPGAKLGDASGYTTDDPCLPAEQPGKQNPLDHFLYRPVLSLLCLH